jgi:hypothetical protein
MRDGWYQFAGMGMRDGEPEELFPGDNFSPPESQPHPKPLPQDARKVGDVWKWTETLPLVIREYTFFPIDGITPAQKFRGYIRWGTKYGCTFMQSVR